MKNKKNEVIREPYKNPNKKIYKYRIVNSRTLEILDQANDLIEARLIAYDYEQADKIHAHVLNNENQTIKGF